MKFDVSLNISQQTRRNFVNYKNSTNNGSSNTDYDYNNKKNSYSDNNESDNV